jgi:hypothetical protein
MGCRFDRAPGRVRLQAARGGVSPAVAGGMARPGGLPRGHRLGQRRALVASRRTGGPPGPRRVKALRLAATSPIPPSDRGNRAGGPNSISKVARLTCDSWALFAVLVPPAPEPRGSTVLRESPTLRATQGSLPFQPVM